MKRRRVFTRTRKWIPAFAGMTAIEAVRELWDNSEEGLSLQNHRTLTALGRFFKNPLQGGVNFKSVRSTKIAPRDFFNNSRYSSMLKMHSILFARFRIVQK